MIITRTPFRVSLCGGGSDIPKFYKKNGGCVLSTGINKYMYITIHKTFDQSTMLKYSETEIVKHWTEIKHKYYKQMLSDFNLNGVELVSTADIPAGTGLGSSSSFTVGTLHAIYAYMGKYVSHERLAREACEVEIDKLGQPIGKQDQYAAAFGGLKFYIFNKDGTVSVEPVILRKEQYRQLEENLMMFYTGDVRSASSILQEQIKGISDYEKEMKQKKMCELAYELRDNLQNGNIEVLGDILHENWELKKSLANGISSGIIDEYYERALKNGAVGGKLLGAGGGGFLLMYVPKENQKKVSAAMGLQELTFGFDFQGSTVVYVGDK